VAVSATQPSNPLEIRAIVLHCSLLPARWLEEKQASSRPRQEKEVVVEVAVEASSRRHSQKLAQTSSRPRQEREEVVVVVVVETSSRRHREKLAQASSQPRPSWSGRARRSWIRVYQESRAAATRDHLSRPP